MKTKQDMYFKRRNIVLYSFQNAIYNSLYSKIQQLLTSKESLSTVNASVTFHLSQVTVNQGLNHSAERLRGGERGGGGRKGDVY